MYFNEKLILASKSPRRLEILGKIFKNIEIVPAHINEKDFIFNSPSETAVKLAEIKVNKVAKSYNNNLIIGADTIVLIENEILGKPKNFHDAFNMLNKLSGKKHFVITGVAIKHGDNLKSFYETTEVYFSNLNRMEIEKYIETKEPFDKAGGYGIQGYASLFIEKIKGDYLNIVGFPLNKTYSILKTIL